MNRTLNPVPPSLAGPPNEENPMTDRTVHSVVSQITLNDIAAHEGEAVRIVVAGNFDSVINVADPELLAEVDGQCPEAFRGVTRRHLFLTLYLAAHAVWFDEDFATHQF